MEVTKNSEVEVFDRAEEMAAKKKSKRAMAKRKLAAVVIISGLLLLTAGWQINAYRDRKTRAVLYSQAARALNPRSTNQLKAVVAKIQARKNYTNDPNFLFIQTVYYVNISDTKNARIYVDKLQKHYNSKAGLATPLRNSTYTVSRLESSVEFAEKSNSQHVKFDNILNAGKK